MWFLSTCTREISVLLLLEKILLTFFIKSYFYCISATFFVKNSTMTRYLSTIFCSFVFVNDVELVFKNLNSTKRERCANVFLLLLESAA